MARRRRKIGEILLDWGLITEAQLAESIQVASGSHKRLGEVMVDLGHVDDDAVAKALASQFDMEYIDLDDPEAISKDNLRLLDRDLIKKYLVLPLSMSDNRLKVVIHDPMDLDTLDNLRFRKGCEIDTALSSRSKIRAFIDELFSESKASIDEAVRAMTMDAREKSIDMRSRSMDMTGQTMDLSASVDRGSSLDRGTSIDQKTVDKGHSMDQTVDKDPKKAKKDTHGIATPIIRLVNHILVEAVQRNASDIHVEPFADMVRLRYRIDGVCHMQDNIPKPAQSAAIARLKIMAGMKIEEKRVPQDGRIKLSIDGKPFDFRVSCCPTQHGESMVLRILRPESARVGLENLGMFPDMMEQFQRIIKRPNGIFLVTGPTGSGKTTTLYTALDALNRPDRKIITAEDPVEYNFKGINQCQVREQIGLTFPIILRAMLRQAPNIILVGEIRDKEVGEVAIQAALTGHLVFSTLHTNDAPSAITRLVDMGIKPFLVASSIQAVLAQRLIRKLCKECKAPDPNPDRKALRYVGIDPDDLGDNVIHGPVGCGKCGGTGFKGRMGIHELMLMNSELRELAFQRAPVNKLRAAAVNGGMRNLVGTGRLRVLDGTTTAEEVSRVAQVEGVLEDEQDEDETESDGADVHAADDVAAG